MDTLQKYIHHNLQNDWENFSFKLDYLLYLLYNHNNDISDIHFMDTGSVYKVDGFRSMGAFYRDFEYDHLTINKNELLNHLKIGNSNSENTDFLYTPSIFTENYKFRCHKGSIQYGGSIVFRFLDHTICDLSQFSNSSENFKSTKKNVKLGHFSEEFNKLLDQYNLYDNLKQNLDNKNSNITNEKKLKL